MSLECERRERPGGNPEYALVQRAAVRWQVAHLRDRWGDTHPKPQPAPGIDPPPGGDPPNPNPGRA